MGNAKTRPRLPPEETRVLIEAMFDAAERGSKGELTSLVEIASRPGEIASILDQAREELDAKPDRTAPEEKAKNGNDKPGLPRVKPSPFLR